MITPSYGLTATERVLPKLVLDWTTGVTQAGVSVSRAGVATFVGSNGLIQSASADTQRIDYVSGVAGVLVEESRTNLLLNSLIDGTGLSTQSVIVTAVAHTLSFYGTGSVALTGAHTATVNGIGAYPARTTLTFTPSVGSLTLTVTGTVQFANLEIGPFATTFIPTEVTAVTRNADVVTTDDVSWLTAGEGSLYSRSAVYTTNIKTQGVWQLYGGATTTSLRSPQATAGRLRAIVGGVFSGAGTGASIASNVFIDAIVAWDGLAGRLQSGAVGEDVTATAVLDATEFSIGSLATATQLNGHVQKIMYWPYKLTNAELQAFSAQ